MKVVSADEWVVARKELLAKERALTKETDALAKLRRELPWVECKDYEFEPKTTLSELFGDHNQLVIVHFMFAVDWDQGCKSCSMMADSYDKAWQHLAARGVAFAVVSSASPEKIDAYKKQMGWSFKWVTGTDFNKDFHVTFDENEPGEYNFGTTAWDGGTEAPGISVFCKQDGHIYRTYSTYARGVDSFLMPYRFLDITPKGRDEDHFSYPMAWVKRRPEY